MLHRKYLLFWWLSSILVVYYIKICQKNSKNQFLNLGFERFFHARMDENVMLFTCSLRCIPWRSKEFYCYWLQKSNSFFRKLFQTVLFIVKLFLTQMFLYGRKLNFLIKWMFQKWNKRKMFENIEKRFFFMTFMPIFSEVFHFFMFSLFFFLIFFSNILKIIVYYIIYHFNLSKTCGVVRNILSFFISEIKFVFSIFN